MRCVDGRPARDRLAVWTYVEHGEEIPLGDPAVTDEERAAAGRETLAERWQALLPGNRSRAAERYAAGGLPDDEDMVRVWLPRDPTALRTRLGGKPLAAWAEDDVLHVLWQGTAEEVRLGSGIQPRLWPVEGAGDLWEASLRIRRLDEAVISIFAVPEPARSGQCVMIPDQLVWRGPRAAGAAQGFQGPQGKSHVPVQPRHAGGTGGRRPHVGGNLGRGDVRRPQPRFRLGAAWSRAQPSIPPD